MKRTNSSLRDGKEKSRCSRRGQNRTALMPFVDFSERCVRSDSVRTPFLPPFPLYHPLEALLLLNTSRHIT